MNQEAAETRQRGKGAKIAKSAAAVALSSCLVASLGLNIYQAVVPSRKTADFIDYMLDRIAEEEQKENEYVEDGFVVGGDYEIRSTAHISDAYKNGDDSRLNEEDRETLEMAKAVLDEVIEDGMDNYEKELAIYQWMVENLGGNSSDEGVISRPGRSQRAFTPHDVLTTRDAVCVGYATTFRLFMNMLGMDVHIVHNEYHSWDLVELEDGQWYHVDVYSDVHGAMYGNFNMTDEVCRMGHNWDGSALPAADSVKYSPAVRNSVELDSLLDVPAQFKKDLDEGRYMAYYRFKAPLTDEEMRQADFMVSGIDSAMSAVLEGWYYFRAYWFPGEGEDNILGLMVERDEEPDETSSAVDAGSPEGRAIIEAIAAAFELDPEMLGLFDNPEGPDADVPAEEIVGGAEAAAEVVIRNGSSAVLR